MKHLIVAAVVLLTLALRVNRAQDTPISHLANLIRANEMFGRRLLVELNAATLEKSLDFIRSNQIWTASQRFRCDAQLPISALTGQAAHSTFPESLRGVVKMVCK